MTNENQSDVERSRIMIDVGNGVYVRAEMIRLGVGETLVVSVDPDEIRDDIVDRFPDAIRDQVTVLPFAVDVLQVPTAVRDRGPAVEAAPGTETAADPSMTTPAAAAGGAPDTDTAADGSTGLRRAVGRLPARRTPIPSAKS